MIFEYTYNNSPHTVNVEEKDGSFIVSIDDRQFEVDAKEASSGCLSILHEGYSRRIFVAEADGATYVDIGGMKIRLDELKEGDDKAGRAGGLGLGAGGALLMPMPGKVIKVNVSDGDAVEAGQTLIVIESMKMEQPIKTPVAGTVKKVHVTEGQQVDLQETLLEVEPAEESTGE